MTLAVFLAVTAVYARLDGLLWASRGIVVLCACVVALQAQSGIPS